MSEDINQERRRFVSTAAMTIAATQLGVFASADAQVGKNGPSGGAPIQRRMNDFGPVKQIDAGVLKQSDRRRLVGRA